MTHDPVDREELARLLPPPRVPELPEDRRLSLEEQLMNEIQTPESAPVPPRRRHRRLALIAVPALAAALAGVLVVGQPGDDGGREAGGQLQATIERIALAATSLDLPVPEPDQYIYVESQVSYLATEHNVTSGETTSHVEELHPRETWMSPDGQEGWLEESRQGDGVEIGGSPASLTSPSYDFLTTLPTDPEALLDLIYGDGQGEGDSREERAFSTIGTLLREQLLPPELSAALYEAAALIPGVFLVDDARDAVGNPGVAVARESETYGERVEWIFDAETFAYLGERVVATDREGVEPGTVTGYTGLTRIAVVDELGERPADGAA